MKPDIDCSLLCHAKVQLRHGFGNLKFVYSLEIFKGYKCRVPAVVKQVQLVVLS